MSDKDEKDPVAGDPPPGNLSDSRTGIMLMLSPVIESAIKTAKLDLADVSILRRYFRAMVHLAIKRLLDAGAPPEFLVAQTLEAIGHELEERKQRGGDGNVPPSTMMN